MEVKMIEIDELDSKINQMRRKLIQIAKETGFNSEDTLNYSQKLDVLITLYQKRKMNKITFD